MEKLATIVSKMLVAIFVVALIAVIGMLAGFSWLLWTVLLIAAGVIAAVLFVVLSEKRKGNDNNNT